jgi:pimeloyl-ACP methyl ester carboxylesterase
MVSLRQARTGILSFIDGLASSNELILLDNRGIGRSTDNGQPFDIAKLADDAARVIEILGIDRVNVLGWSMGGFIAQTLALQHPGRINKLILLSTDPGGADADRASAAVWSQLIDISGTPQGQARRLLSLVFPRAIVATARARLSPDLVNRQVAAMDAWHRTGIGNRVREMNVPVLVATGTADIVIPPFQCVEAGQRCSWRVAGSIQWRWPRFHVPVSTSAGRSHQLLPRN